MRRSWFMLWMVVVCELFKCISIKGCFDLEEVLFIESNLGLSFIACILCVSLLLVFEAAERFYLTCMCQSFRVGLTLGLVGVVFEGILAASTLFWQLNWVAQKWFNWGCENRLPGYSFIWCSDCCSFRIDINCQFQIDALQKYTFENSWDHEHRLCKSWPNCGH